MQGRKKYQEKLFMSFQLSDHVPKDNFYHRLKDILSLDFSYKTTAGYYGSEGQKSIFSFQGMPSADLPGFARCPLLLYPV